MTLFATIDGSRLVLLLMPLSVLLDSYAVKACVSSCRESDEGQSSRDAVRTNGIVLQHTQRAMLPRSCKGPVVAGHGHGDETDGYDAAFYWRGVAWLVDGSGGREMGRSETGWGKEDVRAGYLFSPSWTVADWEY